MKHILFRSSTATAASTWEMFYDSTSVHTKYTMTQTTSWTTSPFYHLLKSGGRDKVEDISVDQNCCSTTLLMVMSWTGETEKPAQLLIQLAVELME